MGTLWSDRVHDIASARDWNTPHLQIHPSLAPATEIENSRFPDTDPLSTGHRANPAITNNIQPRYDGTQA